jgi:hypothetical protein
MLWKILIPVLVAASIIFGVIYWQNTKAPKATPQVTQTPAAQQPSIQTYNNTKYGYSVQYPGMWEIQIFPDTQTGANFFLKDSGGNFQSTIATIAVQAKPANDYNIPFDQYVKTAASQEIQGYQKLDSIKQIKTASGLVGYETRWIVQSPPILDDGGHLSKPTTSASLPITYFQIPGDNKNTLQVTLADNEKEDAYNNMLQTVAFTK